MAVHGVTELVGHAFKPFAGIERDKLAVSQGTQDLLTYCDDNANDTHCQLCGSLLFSVVLSLIHI